MMWRALVTPYLSLELDMRRVTGVALQRPVLEPLEKFRAGHLYFD